MKTAIVTGAGRGIGRGCAVRLGREGYGVVLVARSEGELGETARLVREAGASGVVVVVGDVAAAGVAEEAVRRAEGELGGAGGGGESGAGGSGGDVGGSGGGVDVLVLAAGMAPLRPVEETSVALFREVVEANLVGAYAFVRAAWPGMRRRGFGRIVTISSYASRDPFVGFTAYAAAKAGVNLMTLALDREGKPLGIRAYAVAPGAVETAMLRSIVSAEQYPAEKTLDPEEVAGVVWECVGGSLCHCGGETMFIAKG